MDFDNVLKGLKRRNIEGYLFKNRSELEIYLEKEIREVQTIAFGGSMTLADLGLYEKFQEMGKEVLWHWKTRPEDRGELLKKAATADVYFSSTNAITSDGRLVNVDGNGNRVSAMIFGVPKVFIIAGKNKIVGDLDAAMNRIKTVACPQNAQRLGANTPCAGSACVDCNSSDRLCNITTIIEGCPNMTKMIVCFLEEDLGY